MHGHARLVWDYSDSGTGGAGGVLTFTLEKLSELISEDSSPRLD